MRSIDLQSSFAFLSELAIIIAGTYLASKGDLDKSVLMTLFGTIIGGRAAARGARMQQTISGGASMLPPSSGNP